MSDPDAHIQPVYAKSHIIMTKHKIGTSITGHLQ